MLYFTVTTLIASLLYYLINTEVKISLVKPFAKEWEKNGKYMEINDHTIFYKVVPYSGSDKNNNKSFLLVHGFPSSSFDYKDVVSKLSKEGQVVMHDHLGFGYSDKPLKDFTYSIFEHADYSIMFWMKLKVYTRDCIIVAHDMGDTITTEILARYDRNLLHEQLQKSFKGVIFTNGREREERGMKISLSSLRISQQALLIPYIGQLLNKATTAFDTENYISKQQLHGIWSPDVVDVKKRDDDIDNLIAFLKYKGGDQMTYKTIRYLNDRKEFEYRWIPTIRKLPFKCLLLWGDSDAVAPLTIANHILDQSNGKCSLKVLKNTGHFLMLENEKGWLKEVINFSNNL